LGITRSHVDTWKAQESFIAAASTFDACFWRVFFLVVFFFNRGGQTSPNL
jgi:hypothetical protein